MNYDIELHLIYVTLEFYQQETVEIIEYDQKRNDRILVAYGRGNILFIKQKIGVIYSELAEYSNAFNKWAYNNNCEKGTYKLWWESPAAIKAGEILFKFFLKNPKLIKHIDKTISGDLKCSITGKKIQSIEGCTMHHVISNRNRKKIDYSNLYIPDANRHIIVPVLRKVHDKLPHRAMYLDEFLKWRKKYYKE